tara:strand:- start:1840 stop:2289 length:450 start_codon:yes stop_codon:yes gene_type:complete
MTGKLVLASPNSFRKVVPSVITPNEASILAVGKHTFAHPVIYRVVEWIRREVPNISLESPSYCRVESHQDGHDWHKDTGDTNHMAWCVVSGSVLLSEPEKFTGGWFEFQNPAERYKHYLDLVTYSSDQIHRVTPHVGERLALLLFLGTE